MDVDGFVPIFIYINLFSLIFVCMARMRCGPVSLNANTDVWGDEDVIWCCPVSLNANTDVRGDEGVIWCCPVSMNANTPYDESIKIKS